MGEGSLNQRVALNHADCDLGFVIHSDGLRGSVHRIPVKGSSDMWPLKVMADCWFGSRANIGIIDGKYCFGYEILSFTDVKELCTPLEFLRDYMYLGEDFTIQEKDLNVCRIGISMGGRDVGKLRG